MIAAQPLARPPHLESAIAHAKAGFPVFPLAPNSKDPPLISNWPNLATNDPRQIETWWTEWPDANIGICTSGMMVVDIDPGKGGKEAFTALLGEMELLGEPMTLTWASRTRSGGAHLFFSLPRGVTVANSVEHICKGVDVRGENGYVVAPGSTIGDGAYEWNDKFAPGKIAMGEAPAWLIARSKTPIAKNAASGVRIVEEDEIALARADEWLRRFAPEAIQGGRDHAAFKVATRLYDEGISRESCMERMLSWNETNCHPSLELHEIERVVWSAQKNRANAIGAKHPDAPGFDPVAIEPQSEMAAANDSVKQNRFTYWRADEGARQALTQIGDPLIKGILHRGAMSVLIGGPGKGKTFFVLDWAYHIAAGKEWAGRPVKQGAVVYLAAEAGNMVKSRVAALEHHYGPLGDTPLYVIPSPADFAHGEGDAVAILKLIQEIEQVSKQKVELFVVDTLNRALAGGDENSSKDVGALIRNVDLIRDHAKVHGLVIHHPGKDEAKGGRGHSSVLGGTDTEMVISNHTLTFTKQRDMPLGEEVRFRLKPIRIGTDPEGAPVTSCVIETLKKGEAVEKVALTKTEMDVIEAIDEAIEAANMSVDARFDWRFVAAAYKKTKPDKNPTRQTVTGWMSDMSEKGWLRKTAPNQYVRVCREVSENVGN